MLKACTSVRYLADIGTLFVILDNTCKHFKYTAISKETERSAYFTHARYANPILNTQFTNFEKQNKTSRLQKTLFQQHIIRHLSDITLGPFQIPNPPPFNFHQHQQSKPIRLTFPPPVKLRRAQTVPPLEEKQKRTAV